MKCVYKYSPVNRYIHLEAYVRLFFGTVSFLLGVFFIYFSFDEKQNTATCISIAVMGFLISFLIIFFAVRTIVSKRNVRNRRAQEDITKYSSKPFFSVTCPGCSTMFDYQKSDRAFRLWYPEGYVECPCCRKPIKHTDDNVFVPHRSLEKTFGSQNIKAQGIAVFSDDPSALMEFYRSALGFESVSGNDTEGFCLDNNGFKVTVYHKKNIKTGTANYYYYDKEKRFVISVPFDTSENVDRAYERLVSMGAVSLKNPETDVMTGQRAAYVADPEKNIIELVSCNKPDSVLSCAGENSALKPDTTIILSDNVDYLVEFYRDVLGFDFYLGDDERKVYLSKDGVNIAICNKSLYGFVCKGPGVYANMIKFINNGDDSNIVTISNAITIIAGTVKDADIVCRKIAALGGKKVKEPEKLSSGQKVGYVADPDGNLIAVCLR